MKILRIITRLNVGGPSLQVLDLNRELTKRGHEVYLFRGKPEKGEGTIERKPPYCNEVFTNTMRREINPYWDYYAFKNLRNWMVKYKPDIVHSHQAKAGALTRLVALSLPKNKRPKTIHTYHGHTFHSYWSKSKGFIYRNIERFLNKRTDRIIAISQSQYNDLVYKYKVCSAEQTRIIPLGFDLSELLEIKSVDNFKTIDIGIIGRLNDIKNHELFFDFINKLTKIRPNTIGWVIGDGERKEYLKKIAPYNVYFTGWKSHKEIIEDFKHILDIVICTSKNEGTPVSLIEAMAAGRLVISTSVGGCKDLLGECYYFKPNEAQRGLYLTNLRETVITLNHILENGSYKKKIKNAREYVKENYQLDKLVDRIENLYKELTC